MAEEQHYPTATREEKATLFRAICIAPVIVGIAVYAHFYPVNARVFWVVNAVLWFGIAVDMAIKAFRKPVRDVDFHQAADNAGKRWMAVFVLLGWIALGAITLFWIF